MVILITIVNGNIMSTISKVTAIHPPIHLCLLMYELLMWVLIFNTHHRLFYQYSLFVKINNRRQIIKISCHITAMIISHFCCMSLLCYCQISICYYFVEVFVYNIVISNHRLYLLQLLLSLNCAPCLEQSNLHRLDVVGFYFLQIQFPFFHIAPLLGLYFVHDWLKRQNTFPPSPDHIHHHSCWHFLHYWYM